MPRETASNLGVFILIKSLQCGAVDERFNWKQICCTVAEVEGIAVI